MFTQMPTAIQLAIHLIPTHVLPEDDKWLLTFMTSSIHHAKEVTMGKARNLDKDRHSGLSKQATSVVASVDPNDFPFPLQVLFLLSKRLQVEKMIQANRYTQRTNCYQFGHASP